MIVPSGVVRVLVATRPVDFRKGMDGLAALVRESLGSDPFSGVVYVFRSKWADRLRLLLWDGSGLVLLAKRLEGGVSMADGGRRRDAADRLATVGLAQRAGLDARAGGAGAHAARGAVRSDTLTRATIGARQRRAVVVQ